MPKTTEPHESTISLEFQSLLDLMHRLRAPDGCPWDAEQTHQSIKRSVVEEAYEVLEAIELGGDEALCDELGDLLLQVVFHAEMASERSAFTIRDIVRGLSAKLVRRHPHVFGDALVTSTQEVVENWNRIKALEKRDTKGKAAPSTISVPKSLPALIRAHRIGEEAAESAFDWNAASEVRQKLTEELCELDEALATSTRDTIAAELGDVLFTTVSLARHLGVNAEMALHEALDRFQARFCEMAHELARDGRTVATATNAQVRTAWDTAKERT